MTSANRAGEPFENGLARGFVKTFARPNPGAIT